jgi:hypothetical protein
MRAVIVVVIVIAGVAWAGVAWWFKQGRNKQTRTHAYVPGGGINDDTNKFVAENPMRGNHLAPTGGTPVRKDNCV